MIRTRHFICSLLLLAACRGDAPVTDRSDVDVAPPDPLEKYRALIGEWAGETSMPGNMFHERWFAAGDSALSGVGHVMEDQDTVFIEDLRLSVVDDQVVYSARISTQNNGEWVPFSAQDTGPDTLMFENTAHDFPQCITYIKKAAGGWTVLVTGTEAGEDHEETFDLEPR